MSSHKMVSEYLASELDSHSCPICYERMEPPDRAPMLLFPCGHTLCRLCLGSHLGQAPAAAAATAKKSCPLCRAPIQSQAVNISLQQLIQSLAAKQNALNSSAAGSGSSSSASDLGDIEDETDVSRYIQQFNSSSLRCAVLATKLSDLSAESAATSEALRSCALVTSHLAQEEAAVAERLAAAKAELELVRTHLAAQRTKAEELEGLAQRQQDSRAAVQAILEPLERERDKAQLIVRRLAPTVQLQPVNYPSSSTIERSATAASTGGSSAPSASSVAREAHLPRPASSSSSSSAAPAAAVAAAPFSTSTQPWPFPAQSLRKAK